MLSSNNQKEQQHRSTDRRQRFALRKLTVGVASVLVGAALVGVTTTAEAATTDVPVNTTATPATTDSKDTNNSVSNSTEQNLPANWPKVGDEYSSEGLPNKGARDLYPSQEIIRVENPGDPDVHGGTYNFTRVIAVNNISRDRDENGRLTNNWSASSFKAVDVKDLGLPAHNGYLVRIRVSTQTPNDSYNYGRNENELSQKREEINASLREQLANNQYSQLPAITFNDPANVIYDIYFIPDPSVTKYKSDENINVFGPGNDSAKGNADFYAKVTSKQINHQMDGNKFTGKWSSANFGTQDLKTVLSGNNFTNQDGYRNKSLPAYDGYHAVLTHVTVSNSYKEGIPGYTKKETNAAAIKLHAQLEKAIAANPYELPEYTVDMPLDVNFYVQYVKDTPQLDAKYAKYASDEYVYVYGPGNDSKNGNADYYTRVAQQEIEHQVNDGQYTNQWSSANFTSQDLTTILAGKNFTNQDGYRGNALPNYAGYHPVIKSFQLSYSTHEGVPGYTAEEVKAAADRLWDELQKAITANPDATSLPAYTIDMPIDVHFNVEMVKDEEPAPEPDSTPEPDPKPTPEDNTPTNPDVPAETPTQPTKMTDHTPAAEPTSSVQNDTKQPTANHQADKQLPQTGNDSHLAVVGLGAAALLGAFGLAGTLKKQN